MERYVALAWPPGEATAVGRVQSLGAALVTLGWRRARRADQAELWVLGDSQVRDLGGGWVVGEVFVRGDGRAAPSRLGGFDDLDPRQAASALTRDYWGRYVAVFAHLADPMGVYRDPSGAIDALTWTADGVTVATSDLSTPLIDALGPHELDLDWAVLARWAQDRAAMADAIALKGVKAALPGVLWSVGAQGPGTVIWDPAAFAARSSPSYARSRSDLIAAVDEAVGAFAAQDTPLVAEISGGLDSAIVAAAIARRRDPRSVRWLNFHVHDRQGDERVFARAVADQIGATLDEIAKPELEQTLERIVQMPVGPRPSLNAFDYHYDQAIADRAARIGARHILTGQGGDLVFFHSPTPRAMSEIMGRWTRRPRADAPNRQAEAMARWNRRSIWSLAGQGLLDAVTSWSSDRSPSHPWVAKARLAAPAKRVQLHGLATAQGFNSISRRGSIARLVHPLLSQPVVETVLSIPVIDLARDGRGRALARDAFSDRLPAMTVARRSKGDLTAYYGRMLARSLPTLRPFVLEGRLAKAGLIDVAQFSTVLTAERLIYEGDYPLIFEVLSLEAWVRHWEARVSLCAPRRLASQGMAS